MVTQGHIRRIVVARKVIRLVLVVALPISLVLVMAGKVADVPSPAPTRISAGSTFSPPKTDHELAWYAPLWKRDLKQPPIPRKVVESTKEAVPSGPLPTLLATFVEPSARYAHLIGHDGKAEMKKINDSIDRFVVLAIEPGRVQLQSGDGVVWVEMPEPKDDGSPSPSSLISACCVRWP